MKIGTFILELIIVLVVIFCLYHILVTKPNASLSNEKEEMITKDVKEILNDTNKLAENSGDEKTKKEVEKKINKLMKTYNIS